MFNPVLRSPIQDVFPFSVDRLFSSNEQGVWIDLTDQSTLFQDRSGTMPVTAPGQTVGLVLDKSKGLVLGPNLVTNGTFDGNSSTGWTLNTWTVANNRLEKTSGDNLRASGTLSSALVANKIYTVTLDAIGLTTPLSALFRTGVGGTSNVGYSIPAGTATHSFSMRAADAHTVIQFFPSSTGFAGSIDNISVKELTGAHLVANADAARGLYQVDETGRPYIRFDASDDGYVTPTITPGVDKVQVFAGVRKLSDAARGTIAELSTTIASNNGALQLTAPNGASATYAFESKGTTLTDAVATPFAAPLTSVVTGLGDIAGDIAIIRVNGVQADADTGDQGTGNYLAAPLYIGRRGASSQPFNGRLYSLIIRFGPNLSDQRIRQVEHYVAERTGVNL